MIETIGKVVVIGLAFVVISKSYLDFRRGREGWPMFLFWSAVWLSLVVIMLFPQIIDYISLKISNHQTSIGALFGIGFAFLLFLVYRIYIKAARVEFQLAQLIRQVSIKEFQRERPTNPLKQPKPRSKQT